MKSRILYKYREDSTYTEQIINEQKVWLSVPSKLNDPLECKTGALPLDWKRRTILEMEAGQIQGMLGMPIQLPETLFSLDRTRTKKWFKRFFKLPHGKRVREMRAIYKDHGIELSNPRAVFETLEKQLSTVGIFSLSETSDNQPMWAHYAGNHAGIALGFEASEGSKLADARHTIPVVYSSDKPTFQTGFLAQLVIYSPGSGLASEQRFSFDDPVFRASISTKPPAWSYEKEWRYVEEVSGLHPFPGHLHSLIFGLRMPLERRRHYKALVERSNLTVAFFEVVISSKSTFDVVPFRFG